MESLRQRQDRIRFVQVRHEETAALMAGGYAKLTGRLGVCLATFEQTKNLVEALARGTPDAGQIARNIAVGKIRELI